MASLQVLSAPTNQPTLAPTVANAPAGIPSGPLPVVSKPAGVPATPPVVSKPAGVQQSLSVQPLPQQPNIYVPPKPPEPPKMDKIAADIGVARGRGADDTTILYNLVKKNPALTEPVKVAIKERKATPTQVLDSIVAKYAPQPEAPKPGTLDKFSGQWDLKGLTGYAIDAAKGVGKSFAKVGNAILKPVGKALEKTPFFEDRNQKPYELTDEELKPKGFWQGTGKAVGDILQADVVANAVAPVASAITKSSQAVKAPAAVQKLLDVGGRSALDAGTAYGVAKAQGYDNKDAKTAAVIAGAIPWASAAFSTAAKFLGVNKAGEKIQYAVIKPTQADVKSGFKIENVNKYDLGGSLKDTAQKTQDAITTRVEKLKSLLKPGSAEIDLNKVYYETAKKFEKVSLENAGSNIALKNQLDRFAEEMSQLSKNGIVDIADGQVIKRAFGAKGAWQYGVPAEDANAIEQVYNTAYNILKTDIETAAAKAGNPGVREINKELSEIIPIEHALIRRLPVVARQNPISLTDLVSLIGGSKLGVPLFILNKLTKSGTIGAKLANVGKQKASTSAIQTLISGPGKAQVEAAPTVGEIAAKIPKIPIGLSIQDVSANSLKAEELGQKINELNARWVNNPTPANKKALEAARKAYNTLTKGH